MKDFCSEVIFLWLENKYAVVLTVGILDFLRHKLYKNFQIALFPNFKAL